MKIHCRPTFLPTLRQKYALSPIHDAHELGLGSQQAPKTSGCHEKYSGQTAWRASHFVVPRCHCYHQHDQTVDFTKPDTVCTFCLEHNTRVNFILPAQVHQCRLNFKQPGMRTCIAWRLLRCVACGLAPTMFGPLD